MSKPSKDLILDPKSGKPLADMLDISSSLRGVRLNLSKGERRSQAIDIMNEVKLNDLLFKLDNNPPPKTTIEDLIKWKKTIDVLFHNIKDKTLGSYFSGVEDINNFYDGSDDDELISFDR